MTGREKVIRGLECCEHPYEKKCDACPYSFYTPDSMECTAYLCKAALELLKEQAEIIDRYHKADVFLYTHGWRWDDA